MASFYKYLTPRVSHSGRDLEAGRGVVSCSFWGTLIATDSLKATTAIHSFLGLNEIFNESKTGDRSLFLRKYFATNFTFNGSAGMNNACTSALDT